MTIEEIKQRTDPVFRQYGVSFAAVFGSVARGDERPESDVDILVRFGRPTGLVDYMGLIENLETSLERKVDLVTEQSLDRHVQPYVARDLATIYEG